MSEGDKLENRFDDAVANIEDALLDWELTKEFNDITEDVIEQGWAILAEAGIERKTNGKDSS